MGKGLEQIEGRKRKLFSSICREGQPIFVCFTFASCDVGTQFLGHTICHTYPEKGVDSLNLTDSFGLERGS